MHYFIQNIYSKKYWSNDSWGWEEKENASIFTKEEVDSIGIIPGNCKWIKI